MPKIDHRENQEMWQIAEKHGYVVTQLEFGDYESEPHPVTSKVIRVERKSDDFLQSMIDGRIYGQIKRMNNDEKTESSFLVIDKTFTDVMKEAILREISPNAIYGYIASLSQHLHHPPVFLGSKQHTFEYIDALFRRHIDNKDHNVYEKTEIGGSDILVFPNIDVVLGKRLITHFGTFKAIANASIEQLMEVNGIGKKTAERIYGLCNKEFGTI